MECCKFYRILCVTLNNSVQSFTECCKVYEKCLAAAATNMLAIDFTGDFFDVIYTTFWILHQCMGRLVKADNLGSCGCVQWWSVHGSVCGHGNDGDETVTEPVLSDSLENTDEAKHETERRTQDHRNDVFVQICVTFLSVYFSIRLVLECHHFVIVTERLWCNTVHGVQPPYWLLSA